MLLFLLLTTPDCFSQETSDTLETHELYAIPTYEQRKKVFKKSLIAPAALFVGGTVAFTANKIWDDDEINLYRDSNFPDFRVKADDYLAFVPIFAVYGLDLAGLDARNGFWDRTNILLKAEAMGFAVVTLLKVGINRTRPNGENMDSFPSGHTAQAFVSATFLHREYGHISPWYSIAGYTMASSVGALRIMNDKHYLSDVLFGAGIGILVTNLAYLTHNYKRTKKLRGLSVIPTYGNDMVGLFAGYSF